MSITFSDNICQTILLNLSQNIKGDKIKTAEGRFVNLIGPVGSQRMLDLLYVEDRKTEISVFRELDPEALLDVCPWGHTSPPSKYCPRAGGWNAGRRCSVCISSRWERIIYAIIQMLGHTAEKKYVEGHEIDIYIPDLHKGIEYNGQQHYEKGLFTPDLTHRLLKDQEKLFACARANIQLLFIRYDDPHPVETLMQFLSC